MSNNIFGVHVTFYYVWPPVSYFHVDILFYCKNMITIGKLYFKKLLVSIVLLSSLAYNIEPVIQMLKIAPILNTQSINFPQHLTRKYKIPSSHA